jgi:hypothetical protein
MSRREAQRRRRRDEWLMFAENCLVAAERFHAAEKWSWYWLLRVAGAPA